MKVKILAERVYGTSIEVRVNWIDDSVTPNLIYERVIYLPFKGGLTISAAKVMIKDEMARFKAERDTENRFLPFVGQTFDESQL